MARAVPGPLINSIAGSIGGTAFRSGPGGLILGRKAGARSTTRQRVLATRALLARADAGWTDLPAATKNLWANAAPPPLTGRKAYIASWMAQSGMDDPTEPATPNPAITPLPTAGGYGIYDDDLHVQSLTTDLAATDFALLRANEARPAWLRSKSRTLHSAIRIPSGSLDTSPYTSIEHQSVADIWSVAGLPAGVTSWTFEAWFRQTAPRTGLSILWRASTTGTQLRLNGDGQTMTWLHPTFGVHNTATQWPTAGWHYLTIALDAAKHKYSISLDRSSVPPPHWPNIVLGEGAGIMSHNISAGFGVIGTAAQVRLSSVKRTAADLDASYNGGVSRILAADADTVALWPLRTASAGLSPDISGNGHDLSTPNPGLSYGPGAQRIYAATDTAFAGPLNVPVTLRALNPAWLLTPATKAIISW